MNTWVVDPDWGWWVIGYFFLGGLAAGSYFIAVLIEWFGTEEDWPLSQIAYRAALPLMMACGLLLVVDLFRPERFWHMLLKSEVTKAAFAAGFPFTADGWQLAVRALSFKYWSPMSVGSWGLTIFGLCALASFLTSSWPTSRVGRWLRFSWIRRGIEVVGCLSGFFIASYTGTLLAATNQPVWSDTIWLGALFLVSAVSTSLAAMTLVANWKHVATHQGRRRLSGSEPFALGLELLVIGIFLVSLGRNLLPALSMWQGVLFLVGVCLMGVLVPLLIHLFLGEHRRGMVSMAAVLVLMGGLLMRYTIASWPDPRLHTDPASVVRFGPEDGRLRAGGAGADQGNYTETLLPRSKLPSDR